MEFISPQKIQDFILKKEAIQLVDVREPYECSFCSMNAKNIPMGEIIDRINELDAKQTLYLVCKSGKRAEAVANLLSTQFNFDKIVVLEGGITAYLQLTQPSFEMY